MLALNKPQKVLLGRILSESGQQSARNDALGFRANNEEIIPALDALEAERLVERKDNKYALSLLAIAEMATENYEAEKLIFLCNLVFPILRSRYKMNPKAPEVSLANLTGLTDLPIEDVRKALACLLQTPIWGGYSDLHALGASVTPSEAILKYRTLDDVLDQMRQWTRPRREAAEAREKQQKFGILESPSNLASDMGKPCGLFGCAVIYLDIDDLKAINTALTEVVVDEYVLPKIHSLLARSVEHIGFAYAEGGDEITIFLPNASEEMAVAYANAIHRQIGSLIFESDAKEIHVTASIGIACSGPEREIERELVKKRANLAMRQVKKGGKNGVAVWVKD
ncbi:MAG: GGDEF domain-containing protein [Betaproteobacteria bacterium]